MSKFLLIAACFFFPYYVLAQDSTVVEKKWEGSADLNFYFLEDDFFILPVLRFDKNWLHLEARYNYEDKKTTSLWGGYNFSGGNKLEYQFTPMVGIVAGELNGMAPGLEMTIGFKSFELYSESEYFLDFNNSEDNFLYTWTDLTWSPFEWGWIGISGQRSRLYETDVDIQRGLLAGGGFRNWEFSGYLYNPATDDTYIIASISWSF